MRLYAGIDLHSTNNYIGIIDEQDRRVYKKKLPNDLHRILFELAQFKLHTVVVFNPKGFPMGKARAKATPRTEINTYPGHMWRQLILQRFIVRIQRASIIAKR